MNRTSDPIRAGSAHQRFLASLAVLSLGLLITDAAVAATSARPNIVFLLADDLEATDLRCYGHPYARTPNIDSLAKDGTRFTRYQATGATCCPTRTGLMTSWLPTKFPTYPANGGFAQRITIPELLKKHGYATGHFGKWHIGTVTTSGTYVIGTTKKPSKEEDSRGRDAYVFDAAIKFIDQHKAKPFNVNVWGHIPHNPVNPACIPCSTGASAFPEATLLRIRILLRANLPSLLI